MITDRVGDFIIRLQNAATVGKAKARMPHSTHLFTIAKKLKELGFVSGVEVEDRGGGKKDLVVALTYNAQGKARLRGVKRVSKPGRRLYVSHLTAHQVKGGTGARVISSPKGVVSDTEARRDRVGGEDLFEIW